MAEAFCPITVHNIMDGVLFAMYNPKSQAISVISQ